MTTHTRTRLDVLLVERGLVDSREQARRLVMGGMVRVAGETIIKPAFAVAADRELTVLEAPKYVGRGGDKLAGAVTDLGLAFSGAVVLDVGASTGGFTDVALQEGARRVYAVDVGYGQLEWRLRCDPRVVVLERVNIRSLDGLPELVDCAVIDVSFISLSIVLPSVLRLLGPAGWIVALVKPQFEAGRGLVLRGGVVRDPDVHKSVLGKVIAVGCGLGLRLRGVAPSRLLGPAGNREFFVHLSLSGAAVEAQSAVDRAVDGARRPGE